MTDQASPSFPHTAANCLAAIAQHHGLQISVEKLIDDYALEAVEPSVTQMLRMAQEQGLKAECRQLGWEELVALKGVFPMLARYTNGNTVIVVGVRQHGENTPPDLAVLDPTLNNGAVGFMDQQTFCTQWSGELIFLKRIYALTDENQKFGLTWFIPEILKQKEAFRDVAISAVALHVLALASPLFFQLIIDKVLVHQSYSTLYVLSIGAVIVLGFESALGYIRQSLLLEATNKIDMRLTRRTFSHLLSLPIDFFESATAGVIVRHMQQVEKVRGFLTGKLLMTVLDATALIVFLPLLFFYSVKLALVVFIFAALIAGVVALLIRPFQLRLRDLYTAEGDRQAMLVEVIHGMRTVKALAIEPRQRKVWDQKAASAISMHNRVGRISITANTLTQFLQKLMLVAIIFMGASDVFSQALSVGALIAFQMISGRVVGPLVQMVSLANEYQETALSVQMLGEVMNRPAERQSNSVGLRPQLRGGIDFESVCFRYPGMNTNALDRITFKITPGQVIGIVGRSGSGKTTLTRLIQGMYPVNEGVVRFDGIDAREIDLPFLRKNIGVVLQENFMFRGSIRDNIAVTKPDASFEDIVSVCQAAGADEFIERLPQGYDTILEENANNLSGGQRQRLSIARALLPQPRILILDEAASALDPESEAIFIRNLGKISEGKTVIIVSHRLSTLVNADSIYVFHLGKLADTGRHESLLGRCQPYTQLWNQQTSHL